MFPHYVLFLIINQVCSISRNNKSSSSLSPFHSFDNPVLIVTVYLPWDLDMWHSNLLSAMSFPLWARLHKCLFTNRFPLLQMQIVFAWKVIALWALPALGKRIAYRQSDWTPALTSQYYCLYELILCNRSKHYPISMSYFHTHKIN